MITTKITPISKTTLYPKITGREGMLFITVTLSLPIFKLLNTYTKGISEIFRLKLNVCQGGKIYLYI